jgi:hypothetical protein
MGCDSSGAENAQSVEQHQFVDIPLLSKPKTRVERQQHSVQSFFGADQSSLDRPKPQSSSCQANPIEHVNLSVSKPPEIEVRRQQKFSENFARIDANTFQTMPLMSMPRMYSSRFEPQLAQEIDDYCKFMDQVLQSIAVPLTHLEIVPKMQLVTLIN